MKEFWIKNTTGMRVALSDLRLYVPPFAMLNLLSKNFHYTEKELEKSLESGSLYAKRDKIVKRETEVPKVELLAIQSETEERVTKKKKVEISKKPLPAKEKAGYSLVETKEEVYQELESLNTEELVKQFLESEEE